MKGNQMNVRKSNVNVRNQMNVRNPNEFKKIKCKCKEIK